MDDQSPLQRTASVNMESASSSPTINKRPALSHSLSASSSSSRKASPIEPHVSQLPADISRRASISMPPPASQTMPHQYHSRRPSKASDSHVRPPSFGIAAGGASASASASAGDRESAIADSLDGSHGAAVDPSPELLVHSLKAFDGDTESNRVSFSSLYSLSSAIYSGARSMGTSDPGSVAGSEADAGELTAPMLPPDDDEHAETITARSEHATSSVHGTTQTTTLSITTPGRSSRSRSRTRVQRRMSNSTAGVSKSPGGERSEKRKFEIGIIGVCALDSKARSKPSRCILNRLMEKKNELDVKVFGDKVILDEAVENWPICDFLISFYSDGFPLDKAIEYVRMRKPFCVNELHMQTVLWDRRICLRILDDLKIPTPYRIEVNRDGGPKLDSPSIAKVLFDRTGIALKNKEDGTDGGAQPPKVVRMLEDDEVLEVDGKQIRKPFVEKPTSGEDHNIHVYYAGGGGRRLFRKINNKSSAQDDDLVIPRAITEPDGSYIYEQFLKTENFEDVKAYTVGPDYCHAETRKSPVVDGVVKRNPSGKEVRYITSLSEEEAIMAAKISSSFGQRVCGFDMLRCNDRTYVIDVNGWSFVKDNNDYYDNAARILHDMFVEERDRRAGINHRAPPQDLDDVAGPGNPPPSRKHRSTLKGIFKPHSIAKLANHHPHLHFRTHGNASPDRSGSTVSMTSPPSLERSAATPLDTITASRLDSSRVSNEKSEATKKPVSIANDHIRPEQPAPASKAEWQLKGVVSVIRHADRTPKQKLKFTFHTKPFFNLLRGHTEEVFLTGEAALTSVASAVKEALHEGVEDVEKLRSLQNALIKKGKWIGTRVQIKPMFRKRMKEEQPPGFEEPPASPLSPEDSPRLDLRPLGSAVSASQEPPMLRERTSSRAQATLSRLAAAEKNMILDKLQLIIKWGGEPTHASRYQAQQLAQHWRSELLLLNREALEDTTIFSSSERRSTTTAQIFAHTFLSEENLPPDFVTVRKDLLDDSNAAKDEMDKVKKKLKPLLREGIKRPPQFAWPDNEPEPSIVVKKVVELMKFHREVMRRHYLKLHSSPAVSSLAGIAGNQAVGGPPPSPMLSTGAAPAASRSLSQAQMVATIQPRWCSGEDPELFRERWEKLFAEFCDAEKVDPSKISELYDSMKYDALHSRQFLEWVFTPDDDMLGKDVPSEDTSIKEPVKEVKSSSTLPEPATSVEKGPRESLGLRIGLRSRAETLNKERDRSAAVTPLSPDPDQASGYRAEADSYFALYTGNQSGTSRAKLDTRLAKLRELYSYCKVLFDYIGPQEYGISNSEKLEIGLLTSLPLLKEIVADLEEVQASEGAKSFFYFTKESHIYTLLNCIMEGGVATKISRNKIPELDYLSQITFELYESRDPGVGETPDSFDYSIRVTLSPGCHTFEILDVQLDSKHCIGIAPRRSLTQHIEWTEILETLRAKFHTLLVWDAVLISSSVKLPKSFVAINLSESFGNEDNGDGSKRIGDVEPVPLSPAAVASDELE